MPKEVRGPTTHRTSPINIPSERRASLHLPSTDIHRARQHMSSHNRTISEPQPVSSRATSTWSPQDDEQLMSARASGLNWGPIASKYFPSKTANACRKRHERLMERRNAEDWAGVKLETLAKEYMEVRREMWEMLGRRVGEKWQVVEAKCMEKGLKNLQSAYRSAARKSRGMSDHSDDSGVGFDVEDDRDAEGDAEGDAEASEAVEHLDSLSQGHSRGGSVGSFQEPTNTVAGTGSFSSITSPYLQNAASNITSPYQQTSAAATSYQQPASASAYQQPSSTSSYQHPPSAYQQSPYQSSAHQTSSIHRPASNFGPYASYDAATAAASGYPSTTYQATGEPQQAQWRRDSAGSAGSAGSIGIGYGMSLPSAAISEQQAQAAQAAQGLHDLRQSQKRSGFSVQSMLSPAHQH